MTVIQSSCGDANEPMPYNGTATHPPCEYRDGLPCESCNELAEIEARIEDLHSQLKDLHEQHRQARLSRNHTHSPLIHRFPPEIIAYIFNFAFPPRDAPCCNPEERASPLLATKVCHTMRVLALSTPELWCHISVDATKPNYSLLNHQVVHSGVAPLSIYLFQSKSGYETIVTQAICWALKQLHRTSSLFIDLSYRSIKIFESISDLDIPEAAPLLEELHAHFLDPDLDNTSQPRLRLAIEPPRPRCVLLDLVSQVTLDWTNVSTLALKYSPFHPEHLTSKHLTQVVLWLSQGEFPREQPLVLNQIQDLALGNSACANFMLGMVLLPSLRNLEIQVTEISATCPMLCDFLHRSQCPLQVLCICDKPSIASNDGGESAIQAIIHILETTNMLHQLTLRLYARCLSSTNLRLLVQRLSSRGIGFLRCLQTLLLQTRVFPPIDLLLDAVATDGPETIRPLQTLNLPLLISNDVGYISRDDVLRILQLQAAGKTITIQTLDLRTNDLVEYWKDSYGLTSNDL